MDPTLLTRTGPAAWHLNKTGAMRVPGVLYGDAALIGAMDDKVLDQLRNVATLPGIVGAAYAMPDAHWGYGFPIGGVAAFDAEAGGVVSGGGVGFDISCGVRLMHTGLRAPDLERIKEPLGRTLLDCIPAGLGSRGAIRLSPAQMEAMLRGGARWAVDQGWGEARDLDRIEETGCIDGADPDAISDNAKKRQIGEMGTLGSGNHYLEVQVVESVHHPAADAFGLHPGEVVVSIHCGSRGLGHQIGTDYLREMVLEAPAHGLTLPDRELACAPIASALGQRYLGAMRGGINCALANRQILGHLCRAAFAEVTSDARLDLLFDVSHNTCKVETHTVDGAARPLHVHRKGATRAFGPGDPRLPRSLRAAGQPVLIGGSMGTGSWVMAGAAGNDALSFQSACHGAGRRMSRHAALKRWRGRAVVDELADAGTLVFSHSMRGVAEEAPGAYKDVDAVVAATDEAGLAHKVARLRPVICIKG